MPFLKMKKHLAGENIDAHYSGLSHQNFEEISDNANDAMLTTYTEMKIAGMVKNGMTSKKIALVMFISLETVKTHWRSIRNTLPQNGVWLTWKDENSRGIEHRMMLMQRFGEIIPKSVKYTISA